jgi:hypothetical protein
MTDEISTYTCTNAICGYKTTIPCAGCQDCGYAISTNRNPNSTPTPASEKAARTHIGEITSAAETAPHTKDFYTSPFAPQPKPQPRQNPTSRAILDPLLQRHVQKHEEEKKKAAARIAAHDERYERARGFDEEDDEEFIPNVGKEGESEKKDKGKGKERG